MKVLYNTIGIIFLSLLASPLFAQNETDVLRASQQFTGGTARNIGMGGAFGALGADMSSLSLNPAGIGVYRRSEFTFTPSVISNDAKTNLYGQPYSDTKNKFNFSNIGYVFTNYTNKEQGWVSMNFGIAYNRLNDYNSNTTIIGSNPNTSMLDEFSSRANQYFAGKNIIPANLSDAQIASDLEQNLYSYENLAFKSGGIYIPNNGDGYLTNDANNANPKYGENQQRIITTTGAMNELALSLGANYSNKFYIGMTLGIDFLNYEENKIHKENNFQSPDMDNFSFNDNFKTSGTGYNLKIGMIYKPVNMLRLGLALHTPTFYNFTSDFSTSMFTNYKQPITANGITSDNFREYTDPTTYDYSITTPLKAIGSVALQLGQLGLISADYEYIDYTKAKIRASDDPFTDVNSNIQSWFRATSNVRLGAEIKLGDFAVRGGYGLYGSPYSSNHFNKDAFTTSYSAGLGYRGKDFFFDLGYILFDTKSLYSMYEHEVYNSTTQRYDMIPELVDTKYSNGRFAATIGFRF